jgi:ketosteroid isomerase-like protein
VSAKAAEVVREQFEAVNRRDFERAMELYSDDVELIAPVGAQNPGNYKGREAVGEWFGDWFRTFTDVGFEIVDLKESGNRIALQAHHTVTGRRSGVEVERDYFYSYEVRDGKVTRVEFHASMSDAMKAVGL